MIAPFPWFGGKSRIAPLVWERFGADVPNFVEPFFGSGAVLLGRPDWTPASNAIETVNDLDGFVANFWRALQADPEGVTSWADQPVNENDLHARHHWLRNRRDGLQARLEGDPDYYDVKIAGWWVWGICSWIGSGWCAADGDGPWVLAVDEDGISVMVSRQLVHLGDAGKGVSRKLVHLGDAGKGVSRQRVHLGNAGQGENGLLAWMQELSTRLRRVRVCSGDWTRVLGPSPTTKLGMTAIFLDPPYSAAANRDGTLYAVEDLTVAHSVRQWAIANGDNPLLRIALCGYDSEHDMPPDWECVAWKAHGGYGSQSRNGSQAQENSHREVVWFSPHCLKPNITELTLFDFDYGDEGEETESPA